MRLAEQLGATTRAAQRLLRRKVAERTRRPYQQVRALRVIKRGGIRTQVALAERLAIDAPAASRLVDRLVADGLLERCPGTDRRCVRLEVTRRALPEIAAMDAAIAWLDAELRGHLGAATARTLSRILASLNDGLASDERGTARPSAIAPHR
jgi:DNA-binding MarR family transcriptional regulator